MTHLIIAAWLSGVFFGVGVMFAACQPFAMRERLKELEDRLSGKDQQ